MNMKYPTRDPRNVPSLKEYNYYDWETVEQEDGTFIEFKFENYLRDKGWEFYHCVDKFGFHIWNDQFRKSKYHKNITMEEFLLSTKLEICPSSQEIREFLGSNFVLEEDEIIYGYKYGGVLSMRGGYFIVKKDNPNKIIKCKGTRIS